MCRPTRWPTCWPTRRWDQILITFTQNAYVKGKSIFDAVRAIDDILEFTEREKIEGLMVAIDFKKHLTQLTGILC